MKKTILAVSALLLAFGLAACGGGAASVSEGSSTATESADVQAVSEAEDVSGSMNTAETPEETETVADAEEAISEETEDVANTEEGVLEEGAKTEETSGEAYGSSTDTHEEEITQEGKEVLVVFFSATGTTKDIAEKIAAITDADIYEIKAAQEYTSDDLNWNDSSSRTTLEQNDPSVRSEIGSEPVSLEGYTTVYIGYPIWWGEEPRIMDTFVESCSFDGLTMIPFCTSSSSGIGRSGANLEDNAGSGNWLDGQRFGAGASEAEIQAWIEGLQ